MELSARVVQDKTFGTARRGYDRTEVDAFLDEVARHQSRLEEALAIAEAKAERSRERLQSLEDDLDARIDETRRAREAILDEARNEAAAIVRTAKDTATADDPHAVEAATAVVSEAETKAMIRLKEVEAIRTQAEQEAAEIEREAAQKADLRLAEADRTLDEARREARDIRRRAEADRSEMETQLGLLRRIVVTAAELDGRDLSEVNIEVRDGGTSSST